MSRYLVFVLLLLAGIAAGGAGYYRTEYRQARDSLKQKQDVIIRQAETLAGIEKQQQQLAALDKTHTDALNSAESENEILRRQLIAGSRRLYVRGKCSVSDTGKTAAPGSVGHGSTIELAGSAGQNVFDIRAGILKDRQKLNYLQDYIRTECLR